MLNGAEFSVIGVAPAWITGLLVGTYPDFWAPLTIQQQFTHDKGRLTNRQTYWLIVAGRLGPESTGQKPRQRCTSLHANSN